MSADAAAGYRVAWSTATLWRSPELPRSPGCFGSGAPSGHRRVRTSRTVGRGASTERGRSPNVSRSDDARLPFIIDTEAFRLGWNVVLDHQYKVVAEFDTIDQA